MRFRNGSGPGVPDKTSGTANTESLPLRIQATPIKLHQTWLFAGLPCPARVTSIHRPSFGQGTGPLLGTQGLNRIDGCGAQRGEQAGDDCDEGKYGGDRGEPYGIEGGHSVEHSFHEPYRYN